MRPRGAAALVRFRPLDLLLVGSSVPPARVHFAREVARRTTDRAGCARRVVYPDPVGAVVGVEVLAPVLVESAAAAHVGPLGQLVVVGVEIQDRDRWTMGDG